MTARLTVDLTAMVHNYRTLSAQVRCAGVLKAEAYGLGAPAVGAALAAAGCDEFFVATLAEAERIAPLMVGTLYVFEGVVDAQSADRLAAIGAVPVLNSAEQLQLWRQAGRGPVALHVDTGIHRLGFDPEALLELPLNDIEVCLLLSHYACADTPEHPLNALQQDRFARCATQFPGVRTSLANSAAVLNGADWAGDLGRPGIAVYGVNPHRTLRSELQTVACFEAQAVQVRKVAAGESVGYGASYNLSRAQQLVTLGAGYADGVPRLLSNVGQVAFADQCCPIAGRVSMDAMTVVVEGAVAPGDWFEVFGPRISIDDVADQAQTLPYELLTGIGSRVRRRYLG